MIGAYSLLICKFTNDRDLIPFRRLVQLRAGGNDAKTRRVKVTACWEDKSSALFHCQQ